jgi:NAD(P)-dependent dehydrogenase (short-subunit alcohol dehydrogenase family)
MPTVLITGANRGLGLELARQYAADGWRVLACTRHPDAAALDALGQDHPHVSRHALEVTDAASIETLATALRGTAIDVLLNVAGVMHRRIVATDPGARPAFGGFDYDDWARVLAVNVLAPARVAEAFLEHVAAGEQRKIVTLSSELGSIGGNETGGLYAYRSSKAAVNAVMKSMAIDLAPRGIIAVPMHPGWVRTDMGGPKAPLSAEESASGMRRVVDGLTLADSGRFLQWDGKELPW